MIRKVEHACALFVGAYLVVHLGYYAASAWGMAPITRGLQTLARGRWIFDPLLAACLLVHAGTTLRRVVRGDADGAFGEGRTRLYWSARVAGGGTLAFVVFHLWDQRLRGGLELARAESVLSSLAGRLSTTESGAALPALLFIGGTFFAVAHFAFEIVRRAHARDPLAGERRRRVQLTAYLTAALLLGAGVLAVLAFGTGLHFGRATPGYVPSAPCPPTSAK